MGDDPRGQLPHSRVYARGEFGPNEKVGKDKACRVARCLSATPGTAPNFALLTGSFDGTQPRGYLAQPLHGKVGLRKAFAGKVVEAFSDGFDGVAGGFV